MIKMESMSSRCRIAHNENKVIYKLAFIGIRTIFLAKITTSSLRNLTSKLLVAKDIKFSLV